MSTTSETRSAVTTVSTAAEEAVSGDSIQLKLGDMTDAQPVSTGTVVPEGQAADEDDDGDAPPPSRALDVLVERAKHRNPLDPAFLSYLCLLFVVFTDNVGIRFSAPIAVPYVQSLGGDIQDAALVMTLSAAGQIGATLIIPVIADKWSNKKTIHLSMVGSLIAFVISGSAHFVTQDPGERTGYWVYLGGRLFGGLSGSTMSLCNSMLMALTGDDLALLKQRTTLLRASNQATGLALSPIGGAIATFGLYLPFYISAGVAATGIVFVCFFLRDADDIAQEEARKAETAQAASHAKGTGKGGSRGGGGHGGSGGRGGGGCGGIDGRGSGVKKAEGMGGGGKVSGGGRGSRGGRGRGGWKEDAAQGKGGKGGKGSGGKGEGGSDEVALAGAAARSPWLDPLLLMLSVNQFITSSAACLVRLSIPVLLNEDSFGMSGTISNTTDVRAVAQAKRERIAQTVGLVSTPSGIATLVVSSIGYLFLTRYFSDIKLIVLSQVSVIIGYLGTSFSTAVWHLAVFQTFLGFGMGLFQASFAQLPMQYFIKAYPNQKAQAMSVGRIGMNIGMLVGPQIFGNILNEVDGSNRWLLRGNMGLAAVKCLFVVFLSSLLQKKIAALSPKEKADGDLYTQLAVADESASLSKNQLLSIDQFTRAVQARLMAALAEGKFNLESVHVQQAIMRLVDDSLPKLREWDPGTAGREQLQDIASLFYHLSDMDGVRALESSCGEDLQTHLGIDAETRMLAEPGLRQRRLLTRQEISTEMDSGGL